MYTIKEKQIPFDDSWDVIVIGGGPSGCTAASAAAREGAKTLLVEATGALGGMGTSGLVPGWCPFTDGVNFIYNGLAKKVFDESSKGIAHLTTSQKKGNWCPIYPEQLKRVYDDLVTGFGVKVLFNTVLSSVEMSDNGEVDAVLLSNKAGLAAYKAKVYIDCTGDGDLAAWAGADYEKGDSRTGEMQPATLCFILSNINSYELRYGPAFHPGLDENSPIWKILNSEKYNKIIPDMHLCIKTDCNGTIGCNAGHIFDVDSTDPESVSEAYIKGRKIAAALRDGLAEFHPKAFINSHLAATANLLGIRESRRIFGDYVLTAEDYFARRSFDDEIARNCYPIDLHNNLEIAKNIKCKADMNKYELGLNRNEEGKYKPGESHGIPYRCLTPKGLKNVLVAGRCISCDRTVQASIRVMPVCLVTGEAAGTAAALSAKSGICDVHQVDTGNLRNRLREAGAYLP